jgi:DNA modification methylase
MPEFTLHNRDCLDVLREMPDASVDCVITDPPYNAINRETGGLRLIDKGSADSAEIDIPRLASEFLRIARGSIYVWCSCEQFTGWTMEFKKAGLTTRNCAWWKTNPSPMNGENLWLSALELCVFARKPSAPFLHRCKPPVWQGPSEPRDDHPTAKPEWLMCRQILASVPEGCTVLDPFMGSGTTGVACMNTGRSFIGCEIDPGYFAIAKRRIEAAAAQLKLFVA